MRSNYRGLGNLERVMLDRAAEGIDHMAHLLLGMTMPDVPLGETGDLRASGGVAELQRTLNSAWTAVYFDIIYARRQHEEEDWKHPRAGKAKFLEDKARELETTGGTILAAYLRGRRITP